MVACYGTLSCRQKKVVGVGLQPWVLASDGLPPLHLWLPSLALGGTGGRWRSEPQAMRGPPVGAPPSPAGQELVSPGCTSTSGRALPGLLGEETLLVNNSASFTELKTP